MGNPCDACEKKKDMTRTHCNLKCNIFKAYRKKEDEKQARIKAERAKDIAYNIFKAERVFGTKKKVNR